MAAQANEKERIDSRVSTDHLHLYYGNPSKDSEVRLAEPSANGEYWLADLSVELGINEADLGWFAYNHIDSRDYNAYSGTLSTQGAELLRTFIPTVKENN